METCHVTIEDDCLFGSSAVGKTAIIVQALYGMKISGNAWRLHLADILSHKLGFRQCLGDNDVWMKASFNSNGDQVYDYICIYVNDILIASSCPKKHMDMLGGHVELKKGSVQSPSTYLGTLY